MNRDANPATPAADPAFDDIWRNEHTYLVGLASRMLRDPAEAEDVVQEAFGRLMRVDMAEIDDTRAWLTVVVRRLCLNRLSSAYNRRESVAGAVPPEDGPTPPGPRANDPADRVTLDDQVQRALAVVLDQLTPAERTSFVLHDVFGFPYAEIGELVGRTATTCRQLASRARRAVRTTTVGHGTTPEPDTIDERRLLVERFVAACADGDIAGLVEVLDPDVVGEATLLGGGRLGAFSGARTAATQAMRFIGPETGTVLVPVSGEGGIDAVAIYPNGRRGVIKMEIADGVIRHLHAFLAAPPAPPATDAVDPD